MNTQENTPATSENVALTGWSYILSEAKKHGLAFLVILAVGYYFKTNFDTSLNEIRKENRELKLEVRKLNEKYIHWLETDNKEMRELVMKNNQLLLKVESKLN